MAAKVSQGTSKIMAKEFYFKSMVFNAYNERKTKNYLFKIIVLHFPGEENDNMII